VDRCITQGTFKSPTLTCGDPPSSNGTCPAPAP
jgi:hypothetical protein